MAAQAPSGGNVLTRRIGPLPAWAWTAIAAGLVLLIVVYEYRKSSSASTGTAASNGNSDLTPPVIVQNQLYPPQQEEDTEPDSDDTTPKPKVNPGGPNKPAPKPKPKPSGPRRVTRAQETLLRRAGLGSEIHGGKISEADYSHDFKGTGTPRSFVIKSSERQPKKHHARRHPTHHRG